MNKTKLFCFPYAGGSAATIYARWKQYLHPQVELIPVELAGRGKRIHERLYNDLPEAIEDVFRVIKEQIASSPYVFFGHSLGGLIAFELAHYIHDRGLPGAQHLFISGKSAPHIQNQDKRKYHLMAEDEFKRELIELGGTPPEIFEFPELLQLFLPLLKSDFKLAETDRPSGQPHPLNSQITVFLGRQDNLTQAQCQGWYDLTVHTCNLHYFSGGHFFLHEHTGQIVQLINEALYKNPDSRQTDWLHTSESNLAGLD